ncbi:MAG: MFS transporter [Propionibacteriaceae bacterium]|nr:MFS transporter [Propionibacteriaceae bacterium]
MPKNPLIATLVSLKGNPRACVYTEPLWGLSMNLCMPYASVYMVALGVHDVQIGFLATVGMLSQMVFGLLGGVITDKLGRRLTTAVFDFFAWSIPCLIWFAASLVDQRLAFWVFLGASVVNGTWTVTQNSWDCLLVEDAPREQITRVYSLVGVAGQLSALFAPIAAVLVAQYSLVPAVRILYINAFIVMTIKIVWLYLWSHETDMGKVRMAETRGKSMLTLLKGYGSVLSIIRNSPGTVFSLVIMAIVAAVSLVNTTFWQIVVNGKLGVPAVWLPIFATIRSLLAIVFLFTVIPRLTRAARLKHPLIIGFVAWLGGQVLIASLMAPASGVAGRTTYALIAVTLVLDGLGAGLLTMLAESLVALHVDARERSRVMAVQHMMVMLVTSPFGWIGGWLSGMNRSLPFLLTSGLIIVGLGVTLVYYRKGSAPGQSVAPPMDQ